MALKAADVGRLALDEMEISTVLSLLVRSRILLVSDYSITCKLWLTWIPKSLIEFLPSNHKHVEYRPEGDVLSRLRNVSDCSLDEFSMTIKHHVEKQCELLELAIRQLAREHWT